MKKTIDRECSKSGAVTRIIDYCKDGLLCAKFSKPSGWLFDAFVEMTSTKLRAFCWTSLRHMCDTRMSFLV